jgi:hypothetical protein
MKVYISSGSLRWVGESGSELQAAIEFVSRVLQRGDGEQLDPQWLKTSEQGFQSSHVRFHVPQLLAMAQRLPPGAG